MKLPSLVEFSTLDNFQLKKNPLLSILSLDQGTHFCFKYLTLGKQSYFAISKRNIPQSISVKVYEYGHYSEGKILNFRTFICLIHVPLNNYAYYKIQKVIFVLKHYAM